MYKQGKCCCGEVSYQLLKSPLFVQACHCSLCQRTTGSVCNVISVIETTEFEVESGELLTFNFTGGSGAIYHVYACKNCGTGLWGRPQQPVKDITYVRSGSFVDTSDVRPLAHIFTKTKQSWLTIPDDVPQFDGMYELEKTWPIDSIQRLQRI